MSVPPAPPQWDTYPETPGLETATYGPLVAQVWRGASGWKFSVHLGRLSSAPLRAGIRLDSVEDARAEAEVVMEGYVEPRVLRDVDLLSVSFVDPSTVPERHWVTGP